MKRSPLSPGPPDTNLRTPELRPQDAYARGAAEFVLKPIGRVRQLKASPEMAKQQGAGLGLPLTKRLTELLGGTVEIQSREGVGTMIAVRLPLRKNA